MSESTQDEFSGWRGYLWPAHSYELKKLLPMLALSFLISFNYNILRTLKDALVVTAKSSGAEVIPFIKVWVMFPMAVLLTFLYTHLSNRMSRERVFYVLVGIFLTYFFLFTFVLYPFRDVLHPHAFADRLQAVLPIGCKGFVTMLRYWSFTGFYAMSELWGSVVLCVLFWGFANEITRVGEAKRFYGLFAVGANLSGIAAGRVSAMMSRNVFHPNFPLGSDAWEQSLIMLTSLILLSGLTAIVLFRWMHVRVFSDPSCYNLDEVVGVEEAPSRKSLGKSLLYLVRSRYLLCLTLIVLSYNVVINLVEVLWKHEVCALYPNPSDYNLYMANVTTVIGVIATLAALLVSGNSIRRLGWTFTATMTPVILFVTSILFFGAFFLKEYRDGVMVALLGSVPLTTVVFFGSLQNCMSRGAKYTVFDATKELAFIPLDSQAKREGKAAIDGVCSRLGKSGGSMIYQILLLSCGTVVASVPYLAVVLLLLIAGWFGVTRALGAQFTLLTTEPKREVLEQVVFPKEEQSILKPRAEEPAVAS